MMTDEELAAIRARVDAATPGPWHWADWEKSGLHYQPNATFIAHAREDVPALLLEVERLRERDAAMREIVQAVGRGDMICAQEDFGTTPICVFGCDGHEDANEIGAFIHTSTCPVMKARAFLATGEGEAKE